MRRPARRIPHLLDIAFGELGWLLISSRSGAEALKVTHVYDISSHGGSPDVYYFSAALNEWQGDCKVSLSSIIMSADRYPGQVGFQRLLLGSVA